jgi:hypothetical protein
MHDLIFQIPARSQRARGLRFGAVLALLVTLLTAIDGCNDGSTGCCMICNGMCACGNSCQDCSIKCTQPHGCACSPMEMLAEERSSIAKSEPISPALDAGAPAAVVCSRPPR